MSKLEKYIHIKREEFDCHEPSEELWSAISARMHPKPSITWKKWSIAASVVLLLSIGFFLGKYGAYITKNKEVFRMDLSAGTNLVRIEKAIETQKQELQRLRAAYPNLVGEFENDLNALDQDYLELKMELPNNPNQTAIIEDMMQNLKWQMELLNKQLHLLENTDEPKILKTKNEKPRLV